MAHKGKKKEDKNLVWLEKAKDDESSLRVAIHALNLYSNDYNLTIREIGEILLCDRQWVLKYVKEEVKHIFLNETYRNFLSRISPTYMGKRIILKDYYYFSRQDFYRWLKENTVISRQTFVVDLSLCCDNYSKYKELTDSYYKEISKAKNEMKRVAAKINYHLNMYEMLSEVGKEFYDNRVEPTKRKADHVIIKDTELPKKFTSIKILKEEINKSLEIVYRNLYMCGALKYTIANSLVRYDSEWDKDIVRDEYSFLITIPYSMIKR